MKKHKLHSIFKNIFYTFLFLIPSFLFAQQKPEVTKENKKLLPYYIEICTDKMSDKSYAFGSKSLLCSEDGNKGFIIRVNWNNENGNISYEGIAVTSAGIGDCVENSTLIFLFDDDSKTQITAWNKFNCDGNSYMDWKGKSFDKIFGKKVKAIRFQNGRTFDSYTYKLTEKEQNYFIEVFTAFNEKKFVNGNCD